MGEAKRRKQRLGSNYGCPLGLGESQRRQLLSGLFCQIIFRIQAP